MQTLFVLHLFIMPSIDTILGPNLSGMFSHI